MARKVTWSPRAQQERKEILEFWRLHNGSPTYSIKLNGLFKEAIQTIKKYPDSWRKTDIPNVHVKLVRDYQMFYELLEDEIVILTLWDGRRNPETFRL